MLHIRENPTQITPDTGIENAERQRLAEKQKQGVAWKAWGPYLSERQWGTVREDYSEHGQAWDYFPHDHARSRAYRWGEDGIAGISDSNQYLCFALALWNKHDAILKERFFGLTGNEGNHGEDVKEYYYYLDCTPTHSYMKMLYKYPQAEFPYSSLVHTNRSRGREQAEYELIDTGVFAENRYFDVLVEYAKNSPEDILVKITVKNLGPETARLCLLPQLWFRNTWSFDSLAPRPKIYQRANNLLVAEHAVLGEVQLWADTPKEFLFCDNDTNVNKLFGGDVQGKFFKDGIENYLLHGVESAVNRRQEGTKAAVRYELELSPGESKEVRLRLGRDIAKRRENDFEQIFTQRQREADGFYQQLQGPLSCPDRRDVQRQAFAGMLWSKQYYALDVERWLKGDPGQPTPPASRLHGRNREWTHLHNADILSMPDTWEYPWYAAWDLAFHCLPLALLDAEFAKKQLILVLREWYMHPNGQIPAYEWAFGDVNPPVHAWAAWRVYQIDKKQRGDVGDLQFLERVFHKLVMNFTWWVNRKDAQGRNIFQGGFLGLDNIGVFDRSAPLPTGGFINQADGTSWMAMYSLNLMRMALELSTINSAYEDSASKFFEHFLYIARAMTNMADTGQGLWDEQDGFFYDVLNLPNGETKVLRLRSMVGLIPLFAVETLEPELLERTPHFHRRLNWFLENRPEMAKLVSNWIAPGRGERRLLSLLRGHRMKCLLRRMLDESEFLSPYGVRALSAIHREQPFELAVNGDKFTVKYQPGESESGLFGGNSNWRGPIWFPVNYMIIESLQKFHHYYGDDFKIECPVGSGKYLSILEVADELSDRLCRIFLKDENNKRAVHSQRSAIQDNEEFARYPLFYEYFHGDTGHGVGASHQTGWTGLVAKLLQPKKPCH